jgi:hypothetical protein
MDERLTADDLERLVSRVFRPRPGERGLAVLVDLPDGETPDNDDWSRRRALAAEWVEALSAREGCTLDAALFLYRNVRRNNADLPSTVCHHPGGPLPSHADDLPESGAPESLADVLQRFPMVLAPTEFSATAPLKILARTLGFRGATMPGFLSAMIPALRLDFTEVSRRVAVLAALLDDATAADIEFRVDGARLKTLRLDLRHRRAHVSGGLFPEPGQVGNLPSGEAYIVPYEGEVSGDPSGTCGELPVQFEDGLVVYQVEGNRALRCDGEDPAAAREAGILASEPAYGNLAELGLGVLADFGIQPLGEILIDEKLGLHIAFGRSDHFGGQVGPGHFSCPEAVVHIDRVYVDRIQPRVSVPRVDLRMSDGSVLALMRDGRYVVDFAS